MISHSFAVSGSFSQDALGYRDFPMSYVGGKRQVVEPFSLRFSELPSISARPLTCTMCFPVSKFSAR